MTYDTEDVVRDRLTERCNARAAEGWELALAFAHPNQHEGENPVIVTIWRRPG